ncbi:hypothetical protein N7470_003122 [Penicillium chermesinum]|nr:hypothetical protein N7470_003122 [Penicillium chermesinum]
MDVHSRSGDHLQSTRTFIREEGIGDSAEKVSRPWIDVVDASNDVEIGLPTTLGGRRGRRGRNRFWAPPTPSNITLLPLAAPIGPDYRMPNLVLWSDYLFGLARPHLERAWGPTGRWVMIFLFCDSGGTYKMSSMSLLRTPSPYARGLLVRSLPHTLALL